MTKIFSRKGVNTTLFIVFSLIALIIFSVLYILIVKVGETASNPIPLVSDKYYLNYDYKVGDPLITKQPSLRDMLAGPIISTLDPSLGDSDALVTIVIFSDFECNFCYEQEKELKKVIDKNKDKIRIIWKDYPDSLNRDSESYQASIAARCADEQNKFWEYHDLLFENNNNLYEENYLKLAEELDLNINDFKKCQKSDKVRKLIHDNVLEANALDINGIPFVYINDQEVLGQSTAEELMYLINVEMNKSAKAL